MVLPERSVLSIVAAGGLAVAVGLGLVVAAVFDSIGAGVGAGVATGGAEVLLAGLTLVDVAGDQA